MQIAKRILKNLEGTKLCNWAGKNDMSRAANLARHDLLPTLISATNQTNLERKLCNVKALKVFTRGEIFQLRSNTSVGKSNFIMYIHCLFEKNCSIFKKGACGFDWCLCEMFRVGNCDAKRFKKNFHQTWVRDQKGGKKLFFCGFSPDCDVEDVASNGGWDRHVPEAFPGNDHGGDQVGDGSASCKEGQPHHLQFHFKSDYKNYPWFSWLWQNVIILVIKRLAMTWCVLLRAVETNWEISSQSLAIRYTTGFKPFYFHEKDHITALNR